MYSFVYFGLAGHIELINSAVNNVYFEFGIIMNAIDHKTSPRPANTGKHFSDLKSDRAYMLYSTFPFYDCKSKSTIKDYTGSGTVTYCHSITIKSNTFQNYNSLKTQHKKNLGSTARIWHAEGMVLAVQNVQGPIIVHSNTFK